MIMTEKEVKEYLLTFPEVLEDYPFKLDVSVFKIEGKIFALLGFGVWMEHDNIAKLNLKCDPDEALMLRDMFEGVIPGYHMNKKHWNTVILNGSVPEEYIKRMINSSFSLVVNKLTKVVRSGLIMRNGDPEVHR